MDPLRILVEQQRFFSRDQARQLGYADRDVDRAVNGRPQIWHRIRRGYYTFVDVWAGLDELGRHRARAAAVVHSLGEAVALSHQSGCAEWGIEMWGMDLGRVHVTRLDGGAGRVEGDVVHHEGFAVDGEVHRVNGLPVLGPDRCAVEAGSRASNEAALVAFESLLHQEMATPAELLARFQEMQRWPYVQHLHVMVRIANPAASSVGESRGNYLFWAAGIPAPQCQFEITDPSGRIAGVTDWAWPEYGQLGEFDGKVKYGRLVREDQNPGDVVFAEKQREELLCRLSGMGMVRIIWTDYDRPRLTAERVRRGLNKAG